MTPSILLRKHKTQAEIARRYGYTRAAISIWVRNGAIPRRAQQLIKAVDRQAAERKKNKPWQ